MNLKLTSNQKRHTMSDQEGYCLLAISGDFSSGGLCDKDEFIPLKEITPKIKRFLRNQLEKELEGASMGCPISDEFQDIIDTHYQLGNELIKAGIFNHKWHLRTEWVVWELDDGFPINRAMTTQEAEGMRPS